MRVVVTGLPPVIPLPERLPFAPGMSPFRVKGNLYSFQKKYQEAKIPGGVAAVLAAIEDPAARDFYAQSFLASGWYDFLPILLVVQAMVRLLGRSSLEIMLDLARERAERELKGIYRVLLHFTAPEAGLRRMAKVFSTYYAFGGCEYLQIGAGRGEYRVYGMPEIVAPLFQIAVNAFVQRLFELSGGEDATVHWEPPIPDGLIVGTPVVRLVIRIDRAAAAPPLRPSGSDGR